VPTRLILEVSKFKLRGSEGSSPFGRPSDISESEKIQLVLGQLEELLEGTGYESDVRSQPPSPIRSREDEVSTRANQSSNNSGSQEAFATQVPDKVQRKPGSEVDPEVSKPGYIASLLGRISKKALPSKQNVSSSTAEDAPPAQSIASANAIRKKSVLTPVSADRVSEMTSRLEAKANEQSSQSPACQSIEASGPQSQPISVKNSNLEDTPGPISDDSEKENSQESLKARRPVMDDTRSKPRQKANSAQKMVQISIIDQFQDSNPFQGLKRVPRRYVRIPESQQSLLGSKDSWYRPLDNDRPTYANLPAKVRDDLIAFSEKKVSLHMPSQRDATSEVDSDDSDDGQQTRHRTSLYESKELEGEERESLDFVEDQCNQREPPRICLESPSSIVDSEHQSNENENIPIRSNDQQQIIFFPSMPDGLNQEVDEDAQSEEDDMSWPSSPEQRSKASEENFGSYNVISSSNKNRDGSPDFSESNRQQSTIIYPGMGAGPQSSVLSSSTHNKSDKGRQNSQATRRSRASVLIPPSSPVEEELEFAIPYAVGDLVEENDSEEEKYSERFQRPPSTALQNPRLVQVEQTPFPQVRQSDGRLLESKQANNFLKEAKRGNDISSSDPRIPATCDSLALEQTTPGSSEAIGFDKESEMRTLTVDYRSDESRHTIHTRITANEEDEDNDSAEQQLFNEHESLQLDCVTPRSYAAISFDIIEYTDGPGRSTDVLTPENLTIHGTIQQSPPLRTSVLHKGQFDGSSPITIGSLKRDSDHFKARPRNPAKRRRRVLARMFDEEYPARDPIEIARTNRHSFNDHVSMADADPSIMSTNSLADSPKSTQIIPSTNPAVESTKFPSPEPQLQSSAMDGVQHVPATFEEPAWTFGPIIAQDVNTPMQNTEFDDHPAPASPIQEMEANCLSNAEEDDAVLSGSLLPMTEPAIYSQLDYYEEFLHMYPEYLGSKNAFTRALVNIEWIRQEQLFLPWARYDDFVRILASDWLDYLNKNREMGDKIMSGLKYYMENFPDQPTFKYKFITGENLQEALASLDTEKVAAYRAKYNEPLKKEEQPTHPSKSASSTVDVATTQRAANLEIPEDASVEDDHTAMVLDIDERPFVIIGREASPELGSANRSMFSDSCAVSRRLQSPSDVREASPELGTANSSSGTYNPRRRKPFFETHSQLPVAQRRVGTPISRRSNAIGLTSSDRKNSSSKALPWTGKDSPGSSTAFTPRLSRQDFNSNSLLAEKSWSTVVSEPTRCHRLEEPAATIVRISYFWFSKRVLETAEMFRNEFFGSAMSRPRSFQTKFIASFEQFIFQPNLAKEIINPEKMAAGRPMLQEFLARRNKKRIDTQDHSWKEILHEAQPLHLDWSRGLSRRHRDGNPKTGMLYECSE
jgi:hypothetical protein